MNRTTEDLAKPRGMRFSLEGKKPAPEPVVIPPDITKPLQALTSKVCYDGTGAIFYQVFVNKEWGKSIVTYSEASTSFARNVISFAAGSYGFRSLRIPHSCNMTIRGEPSTALFHLGVRNKPMFIARNKSHLQLGHLTILYRGSSDRTMIQTDGSAVLEVDHVDVKLIA